jgi:hypothetical protein
MDCYQDPASTDNSIKQSEEKKEKKRRKKNIAVAISKQIQCRQTFINRIGSHLGKQIVTSLSQRRRDANTRS